MDDQEAGNGPGVIKRAILLHLAHSIPSMRVCGAWNSVFQAAFKVFHAMNAHWRNVGNTVYHTRSSASISGAKSSRSCGRTARAIS